MCHSLREPDPERKGAAQELPPSVGHRFAPRLVGAAIATVAGLAVAAVMLWPSSTTAVAAKPAQSSSGLVQQSAAPPLQLAPPNGVVIEQTATTMGDDVPTSTDVAHNSVRTTGRHCDHDL